MATLESKVNNDLNITARAIVDNKRIMQSGSYPKNTFMSVLDTSANYKEFSVSTSVGYINANSDVKYSFINGNVKYIMKNSELSGEIGIQKYNNNDSENNIFHAGVRYAVNF